MCKEGAGAGSVATPESCPGLSGTLGHHHVRSGCQQIHPRAVAQVDHGQRQASYSPIPSDKDGLMPLLLEYRRMWWGKKLFRRRFGFKYAGRPIGSWSKGVVGISIPWLTIIWRPEYILDEIHMVSQRIANRIRARGPIT